MNCIIVDDEPLAREAIEMLIGKIQNLVLIGSFNSATDASKFMLDNRVDLVFLNIQMSKVNGIKFAGTIPQETFVIFTNSLSELSNSLIKPVKLNRFQEGVDKAQIYSELLKKGKPNNTDDYFVI